MLGKRTNDRDIYVTFISKSGGFHLTGTSLSSEFFFFFIFFFKWLGNIENILVSGPVISRPLADRISKVQCQVRADAIFNAFGTTSVGASIGCIEKLCVIAETFETLRSIKESKEQVS